MFEIKQEFSYIFEILFITSCLPTKLNWALPSSKFCLFSIFYQLFISLGMLFLMLILVFASIMAFKWKMTKIMGGIMLVLYAIFVAVSLLFSFCVISCDFLWFGRLLVVSEVALIKCTNTEINTYISNLWSIEQLVRNFVN